MEALKDFGLTNNEINVFEALLKLGESRVSELPKETGVVRTGIYDILGSLIEKGVVSYRLISGVKVYSAVEPEVLLEIMSEKTSNIKKALPKLKQLRKPVEKSFVEQFEGKRGILAILDDILKTKSDFIIYGNYELSKQTLQHFPQSFRNKRLALKLKARVIIDPTDEDFYKKPAYKKYTEIRFNKEMEDTQSITFIYSDKVAVFTERERNIVGVITKNKDINQTQRAIFNIMWTASKP